MQSGIRAITGFAARFPVFTLALCAGLALASVWHTARSLQFKTSRADLIDPHTDYHQRWLNYTREFGDVTEDMVVVIEGPDATTIRGAIDDLGPRVEHEQRLFKNVLYKVDLGRLREKALQYWSPEQLRHVLVQLDEFSPILRQFDLLTLQGFVRETRYAVERARGAPAASAAHTTPLLRQTELLVHGLDQFSEGRGAYDSPWQFLGPGDVSRLETEFRDRYLMNDNGTMGFIQVQAAVSAGDFSGAAPAIDRLRELLAAAERDHPGVRLGLTGIPVLESDEMRDSQASMMKASGLSLAAVALLLVVGLRGVRYPFAAIVMLAVGMSWSFGMTTLTVGHLNILSVSFAAMLVGLGIDFAIVYLERYIDLRHGAATAREAIVDAAGRVGPAIVTAAMTTSAAFFAAVLTDFAGVAELGIIAGSGILLCMAAALLVLPAFLALMDGRRAPPSRSSPFEASWLRRFATGRPVLIGTLASVAIAAVGTCGLNVKYDYNLLNLQAEGLDSVEVQRRIFEKSDRSLLYAVSLADNPRQVRELKRKFEALPSVHHVEELAAVLPASPPEDTQLLVQAVHAELSRLPARPPPPRDVAPKSVGEELESLEAVLATETSPAAAALRERIGDFLDRFEKLDGREQARILREYQARLSADLLGRLKALESVSAVEPVGPGDLNSTLVGRFISPNGKWLLQVYPASQIWDIEPLERFITDVRSVDPEATGTPLQTFEASRAIKRSYEQAGVYALGAVALLLLIDFRSLSCCLLSLLPPAAGSALMFGVMGLCGIDLNPANMIVLPLVIGIGVDGGVHVVHDYLAQSGRYAISGSVFRAILLNSLTTMVGFGSMMVAHHRGIHSLGLVLILGVASCLVASLVLLPAVLTIVARQTREQTGSLVAESGDHPETGDEEGDRSAPEVVPFPAPAGIRWAGPTSRSGASAGTAPCSTSAFSPSRGCSPRECTSKCSSSIHRCTRTPAARLRPALTRVRTRR